MNIKQDNCYPHFPLKKSFELVLIFESLIGFHHRFNNLVSIVSRLIVGCRVVIVIEERKSVEAQMWVPFKNMVLARREESLTLVSTHSKIRFSIGFSGRFSFGLPCEASIVRFSCVSSLVLSSRLILGPLTSLTNTLAMLLQ